MSTRFLARRDDRMRMTFSGAGAKAAVGGLVTNDVVALAPGHGQRAAALTVKGRVIAVVRVFDRGDDLLIDSEARSGDGFVSMIKKFVNPRLAKYTVITESTGCLGVYGDRAASVFRRHVHAFKVTHAVGIRHHGTHSRFYNADINRDAVEIDVDKRAHRMKQIEE